MMISDQFGSGREVPRRGWEQHLANALGPGELVDQFEAVLAQVVL
jgi:hypothetical protein